MGRGCEWSTSNAQVSLTSTVAQADSGKPFAGRWTGGIPCSTFAKDGDARCLADFSYPHKEEWHIDVADEGHRCRLEHNDRVSKADVWGVPSMLFRRFAVANDTWY